MPKKNKKRKSEYKPLVFPKWAEGDNFAIAVTENDQQFRFIGQMDKKKVKQERIPADWKFKRVGDDLILKYAIATENTKYHDQGEMITLLTHKEGKEKFTLRPKRDFTLKQWISLYHDISKLHFPDRKSYQK